MNMALVKFELRKIHGQEEWTKVLTWRLGDEQEVQFEYQNNIKCSSSKTYGWQRMLIKLELRTTQG